MFTVYYNVLLYFVIYYVDYINNTLKAITNLYNIIWYYSVFGHAPW